MKNAFTIAFLLCFATLAFASEYHYKNVLVGERASALGEAYVAISDDPSGLYHNPAGIVFGLEDYLSLTANAYVNNEVKFKDLYPGQDYTYKFRGLVPSFFGFTQSWGRKKFGFAVVVPNSDIIDQKDSVTRDNDGTTNSINFRRKFSRQDTTYLVGPGLAGEISDKLSIGLSVFGMFRVVKLIDNTTIQYEPVGTGDYAVHLLNSATNAVGMLPKLGLQYMPHPKVALGLVVSRPINVTGSGKAQLIRTKLNGNTPVTQTGKFDTDMELTEIENLFYQFPSNLSVQLGGAWFYSRDLLFSAQLDYYFEESSYLQYKIRSVLNWSLATEYYLSRSWAVRFALYSNNSKTHKLSAAGTNQPPFVNLLASSAGFSYFRAGTSLSVGGSFGYGTGQGQAFADSTLVQTVIQMDMAIYISGSYQL